MYQNMRHNSHTLPFSCRSLSTLCLMLFLPFMALAATYKLTPPGKVTFACRNVVGVATYDWPSTLITYPVTFSGDIQASQLQLTDKSTGQTVPFQLTDIQDENGYLRSAKISFIASLPYQGAFEYELTTSSGPINPPFAHMSLTETDSTVEVSGSKMQIRMPKTRMVGAHTAPAPLLSLSQGNGWTGENRLVSPKRNIVAIQSETVEHGTLFTCQQIRYTFDNGGEYLVRLTLVKDYPFVILDESMKGLGKADQACMEMAWSGFNPTKRFATHWDRTQESIDTWLGIDTPVYTSYSQEDPHWTGMGWIENPAEEMIFRLSSFGGNSVREQTPVMSFWEENGKQRELGVFVYDTNRWNDRQYGIWQPTPDLSVRFRHTGGILRFSYPLVSGSRSTAIAFFPEKEGREHVAAFNDALETLARNGGKHKPANLHYRYAQRLLMNYTSLSLDRVKDWQLTYPENGRYPENPFAQAPRPQGSKAEFVRQMASSPMAYYPMGLNYYPGIHSIEHRILYTAYVEDYLRYRDELTPDERSMVEALFILGGYVNTLEEMNAIRRSLAGTANMAADGWSVPPQVAFLFPEHCMADEWMDFFEKTLEIAGLFYTRPNVKTYESQGGRWVESLGIYNWAFLRPTSHSNIAAELYDGKNRFASLYMAQRGTWMLNMLTAPINGKGRCFPPHGAHSTGYLVPRFLPMYQTAQWLENYDPLLAEHLFFTGSEDAPEVEKKTADSDWLTPYRHMHPETNTGTNPHLRSVKYTGHGIVLRAGTDTGEELSIHLDQVDKGPNYRWGGQGTGNSGGLYFYARGKVYTAHENEIAGDHIANNLDGVTNFGIMKNGEFRTIGMNELKAPMYDFGTVQFAELLADTTGERYVWPDYVSRSVMLAGTDYFILFDETGTNWREAGRFAWFNRNGEDFPKITFLSNPARKDHWMKAQTPNTHGFYRDSFGSLLTLVTHKKDEVYVESGKPVAVPFIGDEHISDFRFDPSANLPTGVVPVRTARSHDFVFRDRRNIHYTTEQTSFHGKAGLIRRFTDGSLELSLFKGTDIAADGITISIECQGQAAVSLLRTATGSISGRLKADTPVTLRIGGLPAKGRLYANGQAVKTTAGAVGTTEARFPAGEYRWEYTPGKPAPMHARIARTEYEHGRVKLDIERTSPCEAVLIQTSADGGKTWNDRGKTSKPTFYLPKGETGKIHVRALAINGQRTAAEAPEYPVYFTDQAPHYPEGLWLRTDDNQVSLSWGEVLGTQVYRLYRRKAGEREYSLVYEGRERRFTDFEAAGTRKPFELPGSLDNRNSERQGVIVYEYTVTAVNANGESLKSPAETTDPASWRNWYPDTELRFKRQSAFWMPPYVLPDAVPDKYYPE